MALSPIAYYEKVDTLNIYPQLQKIVRQPDDPDVKDNHLWIFRRTGYWYFPYEPTTFIEENGVKMAVIYPMSDAFFTRNSSKTILHSDPDSLGASLEVGGLPQNVEVESNNRVLPFPSFREVRVVWPSDPHSRKIENIPMVTFLFCLLKENNIDLDFLISEFPKIIKPEIFIVTKIGGQRLRDHTFN